MALRRQDCRRKNRLGDEKQLAPERFDTGNGDYALKARRPSSCRPKLPHMK
jgi:hypothetical protein